MLSLEDYRALGQVTNSTWGAASTDVVPTMSVKMNMTTDDVAIIKYTTVVTFQGNLTPADNQREYSIAEKAVDAYLKQVKKGFKELTGRPVKLKLVHLEPTVEMIDINTFSPLQTVRTAYYRCVGEVEVG